MTYKQRWDALKAILQNAADGYAAKCPDKKIAEAWSSIGGAIKFIIHIMHEIESDAEPQNVANPVQGSGVKGILAKNARYVTETFDDKIVIEVSNAENPREYDAISAWLRECVND